VTRALVIGRRRKGRHIGRTVRLVKALLREGGWTVKSQMVTGKPALQRAAERAVSKGIGVVVAVGGDGAVVRVASGLAESKVELGIVPMGTGNLLAGNLDLPHGAHDATKVILRRHTRRIDLGHVKIDGVEHDFAVACGIGFDAAVMDATGTGQKLRWGKLAYLANALGQTGTIRNVAHKITLDGVVTETEAAQVFIANFGKMLPFVSPRQPIEPDDGLLDVIVVRASGPLPGLLASWEAMRQEGLGESDGGHVFRAQAKEVRIESDPDRLVETDGSAIGKTPIVATIRPGALRVIVAAE
jgi:diacylglycerol kinase (ATP)